MKKLFSIFFTSMILVLLAQSTTVQAKWHPLKGAEVTAGWDKYIYSWGDKFIPEESRWVALRSAQKKKKQMGFFWDVPGGGKSIYGNRKNLQLWSLDRKFQAYPKDDRLYQFIPVAKVTKKRADLGYYFIKSKTGSFVQQSCGKGSTIWLNQGSIHEKSFHWKIKNVGKNRFIFKNRKSNMVIDAKGGFGGKKGVKLVAWDEYGKKNQQWEMILIAQGKEVGTFSKMLNKRAAWASKEVVKQAKRNKVLEKMIDAVEITTGWDRYIYAWGDKFIPTQDRWIAIRNTKKKKGEMGFFWDITGDNIKQISKAGQRLQTWELPRKFQAFPKLDRRFKIIPVWKTNKRSGDFGYYYIMSGTKYFAKFSSTDKKANLVLDTPNGKAFTGKNYPKDQSYHWKIKNIGKNKFIISNRTGSKYVISGLGGDAGKNGVKLVAWEKNKKDNQVWEFILIAQGKEVKTTDQIAAKRAAEVLKATKELTNTAFKKAASMITGALNETVKRVGDIFKKGLIEMKYNKKTKTLLFRIGFDNPLDPLANLKSDFMDEFAKIELKKFEIDVTKDTIKISLINTIASMGHHVDLTITFSGKWSIGIEGFRIYDLKMARFSIPFFPDSVTKDIRNSITKTMRKAEFNFKNYPGKKLVVKAYKEFKKKNKKNKKKATPGLIIEKLEKTSTKFLIKLRYSNDTSSFLEVKDVNIERSEKDAKKCKKGKNCKKNKKKGSKK